MIYEKRRKLSLNHWVISSFHNNFLRVKKGTTSKLLTYLLFWNNNVPGSLPKNQTHPTHTEGLPQATHTQYHWHLSDFYPSVYQWWWLMCILLCHLIYYQVKEVADSALDIFWQARRYGESWDALQPPASYLDTGGMLELEATSNMAFRHFVFDLIRDMLADIYQVHITKMTQVSWLKLGAQATWLLLHTQIKWLVQTTMRLKSNVLYIISHLILHDL